jgi:hypothetical protein
LALILNDFQIFSAARRNTGRNMKRIERTADFKKRIASAASRLAARDGDTGLLLGRFHRGTATNEEIALLDEVTKVKTKRRSGGQKKLRVQMRDALIRQSLRIARADLRSGQSKRNITAIVDEIAERYRVAKSYAWDRLKEVDAELPSGGFVTCFAVNAPSAAGVGVSEDDVIKMRARGWKEEEIVRLRRARRPWGDP